MKRLRYWFCAFLAIAVAVGMLYRYGMSPLTLLLVLLLLACPIAVIWLSLRQSRQTEREIKAAVRRKRGPRKKP
jgi:hypothetical protein